MAKHDYDWIVPGQLAQGAFPDPPQSIFSDFDILVLCAEEIQPRIVTPAGKFVFRLPFDDDIYRPVPAEAGRIFHQAAASLAQHLATGNRILVTCAQGRNRSGLITTLTMMYAYGMPASDAISIIRRRRNPHCLNNTMFEQWLLAARAPI